MGITPAPSYDAGAEPPPPPSAQQLAGWGERLGAAVIDFLVRIAIFAACIGAGALLFLANDQAGEIGLVLGIAVGYVLSGFVYAPVMLARTGGQTVGHKATNTRIVMADGSRVSGGRGFVREALVKGLLFETVGQFTFFILAIVNYLFPLWDPNNEALHDKMCRTRVVTA